MVWYAVITTPKEEEAFCTYANEELHLRAIFPMAERHFRSQGIDSLVLKPISAGCVFLECDYDKNSITYLLNTQKKFPIVSLSQLNQNAIDTLFPLLNEQFVMKMSRGIIVNQKNLIQEGPLKEHEDLVLKLNRHKRIAELNIQLNEKNILVGLEITEKR